ncbi:MAG: phage portal protein [Solobacterium sp.]|nr:phage portal protein [Solobacterium sp.]
MSEATYFACLKILSESVGKLPLKLIQNIPGQGSREAYEDPLYRVLKTRPNPYMTASTFWSTVEINRSHYGNAYCLITGAGKTMQLWILPSQQVQIYYDDQKLLSNVPDIWYIYNVGGKRYKFGSEQILHFKTATTFDGIVGLSVQEQLASSIKGNINAQKVVNDSYENGMSAHNVVTYTSDLSDEQERLMLSKIEKYATGRASVKTLIPLPQGVSIQALAQNKLADSQFLEIKEYTASQICAAFGIKPYQVNDLSKSSYSSVEAQNLAFYTDTLLYILKQYEEEIEYKLITSEQMANGFRPKFNVNSVLRADSKSQMEYLVSAVGSFVLTPNEARDYLDLPHKDGGDQLIGNGATIPLASVGSQYKGDK